MTDNERMMDGVRYTGAVRELLDSSVCVPTNAEIAVHYMGGSSAVMAAKVLRMRSIAASLNSDVVNDTVKTMDGIVDAAHARMGMEFAKADATHEDDAAMREYDGFEPDDAEDSADTKASADTEERQQASVSFTIDLPGIFIQVTASGAR